MFHFPCKPASEDEIVALGGFADEFGDVFRIVLTVGVGVND